MSRTVIIDGDIVVYRASVASTNEIEVECEGADESFLYRTTLYANKEQAKNIIDTMITNICKITNSSKVVICLSDSKGNFRKKINPEYKANRKKALKPLLYNYLRHYFIEEGYRVYEKPNLEADDIIGILATHPKIIKGDKCIWSFDKDFKTIPCKFAKQKPDETIEKFILTEREADWWFMYQTLKGDIIDGYTGCRGVGDKIARKLLGEIGSKDIKEMWEIVKRVYIDHGYSEEEALKNARMARILRHTDYDYKTGEVKLWRI